MDVLSSQANIAGYKAVMIAADKYQRLFPMLMTAAGTIKAARVVVLGVGVAGLQAIATAKRLGAVIEATDVRPSVKEQVESLGAKFIDVPTETPEEKEAAEGVGGYAKPMPPAWLERQKIEVAKRVAQADVVITTALIPGRAAPVLVTEDMVRSMKPGSVIVDIAAGRGASGTDGNCPLTEAGRTVVKHGVTIVGETNLPALVAADSSSLYARNVLDFLKLVVDKEAAFHLDLEDDIVAACLMAHAGEVKRASQPARRASESSPRSPHGHRLPHDHQPDHLRAGDLRRLPRGVERHAGAAHAADGGDQRDLGDRDRRRDAGGRPHRERRWPRRWACWPWRWPPSTCSAASWSRGACWRCSARRNARPRPRTASNDDARARSAAARRSPFWRVLQLIAGVALFLYALRLLPPMPLRPRRLHR